jgi:hypothetical protein
VAEADDTPNQQLRWVGADWLADAQGWIRDRLDERGIARTGEIDQPHVRWWSTVLRVPTSEGDLYFKALAPPHVFEAALTEALAQWVPGRTPAIVAVDARRGWMLMRDGGIRLRELVRSLSDLDHWERLLPLYAQLQIDLAPRLAELLSLGVPDQRIDSLAAHCERLLEERDLLRVGEPGGLTADEWGRLRALVPEVAALCEQLAGAAVPETLQHDDFHDGNVFAADGRYCFFDWGDSCVSHPFHTLVVTMRSIAYRFQELEPGARELVRLRDAYLDAWTAFDGRDALRAAFDVAYRTGTMARALAWHRYVSARGPAFRGDDVEAVPYGLRLFLAHGPIGSWR